jgi:hypothetical protein
MSSNAGYFNYYIAMVDPGQINIPITKAGAIQMKKPAEVKVQIGATTNTILFFCVFWI